MSENIIELRNITKIFPGVKANDRVNLDIKHGEIHAIIGENGAGKSTLMKILYGLYQPNKGEIFVKGKKVNISNPSTAIKMGIGMVHQHFMLVPSFTVAENIVMGNEPRKGKVFVDFKKAVEITQDLVKQYGLKVDPHQKVRDVSVGIQQRIEILKTLYRGADILILDEPTAVLTPQETDELFEVVKKLVKEMNKTVILITHKLREVMAVSDRVSVMRRGKMIGTLPTKEATQEQLAEMMVGRKVLFDELKKDKTQGRKLLTVKNLKARDNRGLLALRGVSFSVKSGEILGVAGVEGNGQTELIEALTGLRQIEEGEIFIRGKNAAGKNPKQIRDMGVAHVPEDRIRTGMSKEATITENTMMGIQYTEPYAVKGFHLNRKAIRKRADELISKFDVRTPTQDVACKNLSGGNMQKLIVAREFSFNTSILIISQPTRGIDIGAIEFIHKQIIKKRNEGCAILLVSAELDEIFRLSDRIITMYEGEITGEFINGEITREQIGLYMTGKRKSN